MSMSTLTRPIGTTATHSFSTPFSTLSGRPPSCPLTARPSADAPTPPSWDDLLGRR